MNAKIIDKLEIRQGDITQVDDVAVIVNAANKELRGGGGVDGAIHRAAGPNLIKACRATGGCPTGQARITRGYDLPVGWVIHAVGPIYNGQPEDSALLSGCYDYSLQLAVDHNLPSIAFPAISCGVYGYPVQEAGRLAIDTTIRFLQNLEKAAAISKVVFILFSTEYYNIYLQYLSHIAAHSLPK